MSLSHVDAAVSEAFRTIGQEWALLTAGNKDAFNAMTISWGSLGFVWQRPIVTVMVRPQRYTHEFIEKSDLFTVSFYQNQRKALNVMGSKSGRDSDKVALSGLTPRFLDGAVTFGEAYLSVVARTLYKTRMTPAGLTEPALDETFYPKKDHHSIYMAEIVDIVTA